MILFGFFAMKPPLVLFSVFVTSTVFAFFGFEAAGAATIRVPSDQPTIQGAIDVAVDGDTVLVSPGVYVENVQIEGKQVTLKSSSGSSATVIDGGAVSAVVRIGEGADAVIEGFTVQNAGGPIDFDENGHGIVVTAFTVVRALIQNNVIADNPIRAGIGIIGGTTGVDVEVEIRNNLVINNFRGIKVDLPMDPNIPGFVRIINNVVAFNQVDGGDPSGAGVLLLACCAFGEPGNFMLDVVNNTVYGNAAIFGGGLAANASNLRLFNNIFFANSATEEGPDFHLVQAALDATIAFNIIGDGQFTGINGNLAVNPFLVNPAGGDFHLRRISGAIDAGHNMAPGLPSTDFDGNERVLDGDHDGKSVVDMGAFEFIAGPRPKPKSMPWLMLLLD